jgi:quercetin dioxygenase-like cupin family protein
MEKTMRIIKQSDDILNKSLMKLLTLKLLPKEEATNRPIFFGGKVSSQGFVDSNNSDFFNMAVVSFEKGARNKFHVHSSDQILYVTSGRGIVATEEQEYVVSSGTTIHIPAGERHWHGATNDGAFAHITVTPVGSTTEIREL